MSEQPRSKKEIELDVLLKHAELKHKEAELKQKQAEIEKIEAETQKTKAEAGKAEIEYEKNWSARQKELLNDEENHLYRFSKEVGFNSVQACMHKLTQPTA